MTSLRGRLAEAVLYLCTDARERQGDTEGFLDRALGGGVDIVQLRHKGLEAGAELRYLETFRRACDKHGALLAVNDRADVAYAAGADVLHLGQDDLPAAVARQICGPDIVIGLSSHDEQQAADQSVAARARAAAGQVRSRSQLGRSQLGRPRRGAAVVRDRRDRSGQPGPGAGRGRQPGGRGTGHHRGGRPRCCCRGPGRPAPGRFMIVRRRRVRQSRRNADLPAHRYPGDHVA